MSLKHVERWKDAAMALEADKVSKPRGSVRMLHRELVRAAEFVADNYEATKERPGFATVAFRVQKKMSSELRSLDEAITYQHSRALFGGSPSDEDREVIDEAREVIEELEGAVDFVLDDGVDEPADLAAAGAKRRRGQDESIPTLTEGLQDLSVIGAELESRLTQIEGFDMKLVARAGRLADKLSKLDLPSAGSADIDLRNRLLELADQRLKTIRTAGTYVFRHHPDLLAQLPNRSPDRA